MITNNNCAFSHISPAVRVSVAFLRCIHTHSLTRAPSGSAFNLPSCLKTLAPKLQLTYPSVHPAFLLILTLSHLNHGLLVLFSEPAPLSAVSILVSGDSVLLAQQKATDRCVGLSFTNDNPSVSKSRGPHAKIKAPLMAPP